MQTKILFLLTTLSIFCIAKVFSQAPGIEWQNSIGGSGGDYLFSTQQTSDGGYILGGYSFSGISGDKTEDSLMTPDYWVVKLNNTGSIEWQNTIGGNCFDYLCSIQQTSGGGYIIGGYSCSDISGDKTEDSLGGYDYWVVKLNTIGDIEWQNTIGGSGDDILSFIQQTSDGGYILGGYSDSDISGDKTGVSLGISTDYWVVKLNNEGDIEWQKTIGGSKYDVLLAIQQTSDDGYILGGYSNSEISGDKAEASLGGHDFWVLKLSNTGDIEWQNTIGGNSSDFLTSIQQTSEGGYILGGRSSSDISGDKTEAHQDTAVNYDYWVVKLNSSGVIEWQNTIGGSRDDYLLSARQTLDGGYILGGFTYSKISGDKTEALSGPLDYWVVKLNSTGIIEWENAIGGSGGEVLRSIQQTTDGGYLLGGYSDSGLSNDKSEASNGHDDYWVVKLYSEASIRTSVIFPLHYIQSDSVNVSYSTTAIFNTGNIFTAQLSDSSGNFTSPVSIGSLASITSGTITAVIPLTSVVGTGYRIRVVSSDSVMTGSDNGQDIVINAFSCDIPAGEYTDQVMSASAKVHWKTVGTASKYKVQYRVTGSNTWLKYSASNNYKQLKGLLPDTEYDWQVKSICKDLGLGNSAWSVTNNFTTDDPIRHSSDEEISFEIYPNPFTSSTTISFSIRKSSNVTIELCDMAGKKLQTILNENLDSGLHVRTCQGISLPAGIYLLNIYANEEMRIMKVMVE